MNTLKWLLTFVAVFSLAAAQAEAGALAVKDGSGSSQTVGVGTDGTNLIPGSIICGASATATLYAQCVNQWIINTSGQGLVLASEGGTWNIGNVTGTVTLPTGAATSANQSSEITDLASIIAAQTSGAQKAQNVDASGNTLFSAAHPGIIACLDGTNNCFGGSGGGSAASILQTTNSKPISITSGSSTTTSLVTHGSGTYTYVTGFDITANGTGTFQLVYGTTTTTACDTGQQPVTGAYSWTAQTGISKSSQGATFVVPVTDDLCMITTGSGTAFAGSLQYAQSSTALSAFGGGGGGSSPFISNGNNISNTSVATTTTNAALTGSPSTVVINNNGTVSLLVKAVSSSGGTVTATNADLIVPANSTFALGTNGNAYLAYMAVGGTGSVLITEGSGTFTGAGGGGGSSASSVTVNNLSTSPIPTTPANVVSTQVTLTGTNGVNVIGYIPTATSPAINISQSSGTTTTQLVAGSPGLSIYITSWDVAAPSGTFQLEYGTGSTCTSPTIITGAYTMNGVQVGKGAGSGVVGIVPSSLSLCAVTTGTSITFAGGLTVAQQ